MGLATLKAKRKNNGESKTRDFKLRTQFFLMTIPYVICVTLILRRKRSGRFSVGARNQFVSAKSLGHAFVDRKSQAGTYKSTEKPDLVFAKVLFPRKLRIRSMINSTLVEQVVGDAGRSEGSRRLIGRAEVMVAVNKTAAREYARAASVGRE